MFKNTQSTAGVSCDVLKCIAMLTMTLNHIAHVFISEDTWAYMFLVSIGHFTAPLMCWLIVDGYHYTHSVKKYALRLFVFALLSQFPYMLAFSGSLLTFRNLNMLFTLLLSLGITAAWYEIKDEMLRNLIIFVLLAASSICDWNIIGPLLTILYLRFSTDAPFANASFDKRNSLKKACLVGFLVVFISITATQAETGSFSVFGSVTAGAVLFGFTSAICAAAAGLSYIYLYNGRRAKKGATFFKWFFYLFYPVHLLVIGLARELLK